MEEAMSEKSVFWRNFEAFGTGHDSAADEINKVLEEYPRHVVGRVIPIELSFAGGERGPGLLVEFVVWELRHIAGGK
jgi:hypothetical protein